MVRRVLVWLPLPPHANWRGEGIAQTLEHWFDQFNDEIHFHLYVNSNAAESLGVLLGGRKNFTLHGAKKRVWGRRVHEADIDDIDDRLRFLDYVDKYLKLSKLFKIFGLTNYSVRLKIATFLFNRGFIFRGYDFVWAPVPSIPFVESLKGKVIYNFWDPFVLEYGEFDQINSIFAAKFDKIFRRNQKSRWFVTQSVINKRYLADVFGVKSERVSVVRLGCPDYSQYIDIESPEMSAYRQGRSIDIFDIIPFKKNIKISPALDRKAAFNIKLRQLVSKSTFYRLACGFKPQSKVVFISTQDRPYKGIHLVFKVLAKLKENCPDFKLHIITTCKVPVEIKNKYPELYESIIEFKRLPNSVHAFVTAISDLVLHPSYVEGGLGSYSMFEAASVMVPSLTNKGRHTDELEATVGLGINIAFADFTDVVAAADRIKNILSSENDSKEIVAAVRAAWYSWSESSEELIKFFKRI